MSGIVDPSEGNVNPSEEGGGAGSGGNRPQQPEPGPGQQGEPAGGGQGRQGAQEGGGQDAPSTSTASKGINPVQHSE